MPPESSQGLPPSPSPENGVIRGCPLFTPWPNFPVYPRPPPLYYKSFFSGVPGKPLIHFDTTLHCDMYAGILKVESTFLLRIFTVLKLLYDSSVRPFKWLLGKVQLFWKGHINLPNLPYDFDIYLVNIKTIRLIAQILVAFSEKLNFNSKRHFQPT